MNILVIGYANKKCANVYNWETSMKKYGYKYIVIGDGEKWENFMTKIRSCRKYLVDPEGGGEYDLVIVCDVFDIYACAPSSELEKRYKAFDCDLLVGAEELLLGQNIPVTEYWKHHHCKNHRKYVNAGFMMGSPRKLIDLYDFILDLGIKDDQVALAHYCNRYPDRIALDQEQTIVCNVVMLTNVFHVTSQFLRPRWSKKNVKSLFVHTPGMMADFSQRYVEFGRDILGKDFILPSNNYRSILCSALTVGFLTAVFILLIYFNVQLGILFLVVATVVAMYVFTNMLNL